MLQHMKIPLFTIALIATSGVLAIELTLACSKVAFAECAFEQERAFGALIARHDRDARELEDKLETTRVNDAALFILNGRTDPLWDAQLLALTAQLKAAREKVDQDRGDFKRECGREWGAVVSKPKSKRPPETEMPNETGMLDTSKLRSEVTASGDTFEDRAGNRVLLKSAPDYHWVSMYGYFTGRRLVLECPIRTSLAGNVYTYDCNFYRTDFEPGQPSNVRVTSQGRAHIQLTLVQNQQSLFVITFEPAPVKDPIKHTTTTSRAGSVSFHQISQ